MREHGFDWFDYHGTDESKIDKTPKTEPVFDKVFNIFSFVFFFIFCVSCSLHFLFKLVPPGILDIYGISVVQYNFETMLFTGTFRTILFVMFLLLMCLQWLGFPTAYRVLDSMYRFLAISIWMLIYFFRDEEKSFKYFRQTCLTVSLISFAYSALSLLLRFFEENFVKSVLHDKIRKTGRTEEIVSAFKRYAYDIPQQVTLEGHRTTSDMFCIDFNTFMTYCIVYDDHAQDMYFSQVTPPELWCLKDALRLARDVFTKAVPDGDEMSYNDLKSIFPSVPAFDRSKMYININEKKGLRKKEFRDVVAGFYYHRLLLERSVRSQLSFVALIKKLVYIPASLLVLITCLVIFGANLKELFAVLVSSAIVVHLMGNAMVKDLWKGLIFILSHRFDVGDEVVIDKQELTVTHIGIISSTFTLPNGGITKIFNYDLCGKPIVNMTSAPQNLLMFTLDLPPSIANRQLERLKCKVAEYVRHRLFDYHNNFSMVSSTSEATGIGKLQTAIILECRGDNSKAKNFMLRAEFLMYLNEKVDEVLRSTIVDSNETGCSHSHSHETIVTSE